MFPPFPPDPADPADEFPILPSFWEVGYRETPYWGFCTTSASCPGASAFASWTLDIRPPLGSSLADDLKSALPWTDRTGDTLAKKHGVEGQNSGWKDRYEGPFE